jgi:hypothetical protein
MSLVPHDKEFAREQCIAAAFAPAGELTDWDAVVAQASDLDPDQLSSELKAGEPYASDEIAKLTVFRLQTKVRIALRCRRGLPQFSDAICGTCGKRQADPVLSFRNSWDMHVCLWCEEEAQLFERSFHGPAIAVSYDLENGCWGISYVSQGGDQAQIAIIVTGYPERQAAQLACSAPVRFATLFNRVCPAGLEASASDLVPSGELFALDLPLSPSGWRRFLENQMRLATPCEATPYAHEIGRAIDAYFSRSH